MLKVELLVDRQLDDGRLVVVNCGQEDIPVGTVLTQLCEQLVEQIGESFNRHPHGEPELVELKIESIDIFRRSVEVVPKGYSAALKLSGVGLDAVVKRVSSASKEVQVFLS